MSDSDSEFPDQTAEVKEEKSPSNVLKSIEVIWDDDKIEKVSQI